MVKWHKIFGKFSANLLITENRNLRLEFPQLLLQDCILKTDEKYITLINDYSSHPSLTAVTQKKCLSIATMSVGFSDPIGTLPCIFEKNLLGNF